MAVELITPVQAALEVLPSNKKDHFDRAMEVAHLLMDGTVGTVCGCINGLFQTYALIQANREQRKIVEYTCNYAEAKQKADVEMRRLDVLEKYQFQQYDLQKRYLTLYVDRQFQNTVDAMTTSFQRQYRQTERERYDMVRRIDDYTMLVTSGMDAKYRQMLRQEEVICAAYRDALHQMTQYGISKNQVAVELYCRTVDKIDQFSDAKFQMALDFIERMTVPSFPTFEQFVSMQNDANSGRLM